MLLSFTENKVKAVFEVTEDKNLLLLHLSDRDFEDNIPPKARKYFSALELQLSGSNQDDHHGCKQTVTSGSRSLKYVSHTYDGNKLEITLADEKVRAVCHYRFFDDCAAVRTYCTVENICSENVGLEYVSSLSLTGLNADDSSHLYIPHNSWCREVNWKKYTLSQLGLDEITTFSTKRICCKNTGTWSAKEYLPMGCIEGDGAVMWQIENNGSWYWEISDISDKLYLRLSGPTEKENSWYKSLAPGEKFESVGSAVSFGNDFNGALENMTLYRRHIAMRRRADADLPIIFNDYMNCLLADPTTEKMLPVIDAAARAGAEYYVMDAGWYADGTWWETVGEWEPCAKRFPGGMKAVFDYIRSKGMVPGIWLEIEVMGIHCPLAKSLPDDWFFMRHGRRVIDHGRYQLDFRNENVRSFAAEVADRLIADYGVGYIKMDYNIEAGAGTELDADSLGDGLLTHNRAYLKWLDGICEKHPDLIVENCSSGGMRLDYAMMAHHSLASVSDQEDCVNTSAIAASAATAVLPEQALVWSYPLKGDSISTVQLNMVNSMLLRMNLSGGIMNLSDEQFSAVSEGVRCYKEIRRHIPEFIVSYPLGVQSLASQWLCTLNRYSGGAYVSVWRRNSEETGVEIPLGFSPENAEVVYPKSDNCKIALCGDKLNVTLSEKNSAVIVKLV